jgi:hypothetical protein
MSISNIGIIKLVNKLDYDPKSTDLIVAGYSVIFLCISIFFYWILIAMFELKFVKFLNCSRSNKSDDL